MSTNNKSEERSPVEVTDWNDLVRYAQFLCGKTDKKFKICMIDEEQEEIRIENKDEFDTNVKYAQNHNVKSIQLNVYVNDLLVFNGIYHIKKPIENFNIRSKTVFPSDKLQILRNNILVKKWYIPIKLNEELGLCLTAAIDFAKEGKLDTNVDCKQFIETIVPDAFQKLQCSQSVFSWPREVQCGIFDMIELLVDLVGTRLRYPPVPTTLLNTLSMTFDTNSIFSQKHKDEQLPTNRVYVLDNKDFLRTNLDYQNQTYGWLRSFIQRFIAQNGLKNIQSQFEFLNNSNPTTTTTMDYISLLKIFCKSSECINANCFRLLFTRSIRQVIEYYFKTTKNNKNSDDKLNQLHETLTELCFNYEMNNEINELLELKPITTENQPEPVLPFLPPLEELTINKKSKIHDSYEQLAEDIRLFTMDNGDAERKNIKKQRTDQHVTAPLVSRQYLTDCTTDDLSSKEKRSLKRRNRREQRHLAKKEKKRTNPTPIKTYDRSDSEDIIRYFTPMRIKISALYDDLQRATSLGNIHEVLKIEEKLKLLRPYSARFIADENTPDGTIMKPGQVFRKGWVLLNDGSMPWCSDDIQLINLSDDIKVIKQPIVPVTAPHDRTVIYVEFMCANEFGSYESKWILSYREKTFGPMFWCSIEVGDSTLNKPINLINDTFDLVDVPLPSCFDLTKPFRPPSEVSSLRSSFTLSLTNSTDTTQSELLLDTLEIPDFNDNTSLQTVTNSSSTDLTEPNELPLIELTPAIPINNQTQQQSPKSHQSFDFVDTVVTNIFSVAKQAGSTAKAIFNTLQANDETNSMIRQKPNVHKNPTDVDDFFEHIEQDNTAVLSPMATLIEMGFTNRPKNQQLLTENHNDLSKVIELLTTDKYENPDWFRPNQW